MLSLAAFDETWQLGLPIFGVHLLLLGYLFRVSRQVPRLVSILVVVAGAGYLIDASGSLLAPDLENPRPAPTPG